MLRTRGGGLKIFDDRSTLPTHPVPKLSCIMTTEYVQIPTDLRFFGHLQTGGDLHKTGDVLRQWVFIGECCDVTSIGTYTQSTVWGLLGVVLHISVVGSHK